MAKTLVGNLAGEWDPAKYTDEYRSNLMKIIKAKVKGVAPHLTEQAEPRQAEVIDLMERLRQSLGTAPAATRITKAEGGRRKAGTSKRGARTREQAADRGRRAKKPKAKKTAAKKRRRAA